MGEKKGRGQGAAGRLTGEGTKRESLPSFKFPQAGLQDLSPC